MTLPISSGSGTFNTGVNYQTHGVGSTSWSVFNANTGIGIYAAATGIGIYGAGTGISIQGAGGGGSHNNMQPFAATNKIIKL
jgi:microcystin-dependent protein